MTLGQKQELFSRLLVRLLDKAHSMGYDVRMGDVYRDPRLHGELGIKLGYGHKNSCHKVKLAADLNLFRDGKWLSETADHKALGEWWETQDPLCRWGGRFNDGNHYSLEHDGNM